MHDFPICQQSVSCLSNFNKYLLNKFCRRKISQYFILNLQLVRLAAFTEIWYITF